MNHGRFETWMKGCLCDPCYRAARLVSRARVPRKAGHPKTGVTHGIRATYVDGCHCARCTEADRTYHAARRNSQREAYNAYMRDYMREYNRRKRAA